ncbi:protein transporter tim10 [Podochytrium sp. JEL0797]|nr:protein transporter tim10 [Podochytrium sp. JEL0797]
MQGMTAWEQELAAEVEADFRRRLIANCQSKCVSPAYLQDGELNKGEAVCLDRCVHKFMAVNTLVQKTAQNVGESMYGAIGMDPSATQQ